MDHHGISARVCYYTAAWLKQEKHIMNKICCMNKFGKNYLFCSIFFYSKLWSSQNDPSSSHYVVSKFVSVVRQKYEQFFKTSFAPKISKCQPLNKFIKFC